VGDHKPWKDGKVITEMGLVDPRVEDWAWNHEVKKELI